MKKLYSIIFQVGALLLLVGAASYITHWVLSPYIYIVGAAAVAIAQTQSVYDKKNIVLKRLYRQQLFGGLFLFIAGVLMFTLPRGNEWMLALTIGTVLELYTSFRIPQEEKKY